jgi:hypothetical protein
MKTIPAEGCNLSFALTWNQQPMRVTNYRQTKYLVTPYNFSRINRYS